MFKKLISKTMLAVLLLLAAQSALCNQYKELSLEDKAKASDLVVIAKIASVSTQGCKEGNTCANIEITSSLKGKHEREILVLFNGPIAETNPQCCQVGAVYLFFLEKVDSKFYRSANGPFGVYQIVP